MDTIGPEWLLDIFIPGQARPQGSKRAIGRGRMVESSIHVGAWRERVAWFAHQAWSGSPIARDVPVATLLEFVMPRPVSLPKRSTPPMTKQPDCDKLLRAVNDSLTGVVWTDDAQVVDSRQVKRYAEIGETAGVRIRVARAA